MQRYFMNQSIRSLSQCRINLHRLQLNALVRNQSRSEAVIPFQRVPSFTCRRHSYRKMRDLFYTDKSNLDEEYVVLSPNSESEKQSKDKELPMESSRETGESSSQKQVTQSPSTVTRSRTNKETKNIVLPSVPIELNQDNSVRPEPPLKHILSLVKRKFFRQDFAQPGIKRHKLPAPETIQKVVIVGVHGWFPGRLISTVFGEPAGISPYFIQKMTSAVIAFFYSRYQLQIPMDSIKTISLEGEGKVLNRVDMFYDMIQDTSKTWKKDLLEADLILVAAHSQGMPVSILLLDRLIQERIVNPDLQRICVLGMAGISHGPFPHLKSNLIVKYVEADAARELFEFNDPRSFISVTYTSAVMRNLYNGVRLVAVGSWYDQVVPLYSAVIQGVDHPALYRALYIDAADYLPDFLSHLVVLALKIKNAGYSDHSLLIYLSDILAGNIFGFGTQGHSALYEENSTYLTAVAWSMSIMPEQAKGVLAVSHSFKAPLMSKLNPYLLPWIMAKLLSDDLPLELKRELQDVVAMYQSWEPQTREAKELKYKLEGLRAKL